MATMSFAILIKVAKEGGGFHNYVWNKPSTGQLAAKVGHAVYLDKWNWMIGTGLYTDDVRAEVAAMQGELETSIDRTTGVLALLSAAGVLLAALFTWSIRLSEQRFADRRLKDLTHRIVEVQEDERKRVSTELHDGISQLLVSARYGLDQALARTGKSKARLLQRLKNPWGRSKALFQRCVEYQWRFAHLSLMTSGLLLQLRALGRDFAESSGSESSNTETQRTNGHISSNAQTALYRVAQEALTNIAKHSNATKVWIRLKLIKNLLA